MWLTDQFVRRPISVLIVGYAVLIFLTYLSVTLEYFEISDTEPRDFLIWRDPKTVDLDMFNIANEYMEEKIGSSKQGIRSKTANQMFIMYSNLPGNKEGVLKKDILLKMQKIE